MRFLVVVLLASSAFANILGPLVARQSFASDVCADVTFDLKVPHLGKDFNCGKISACLCKSTLDDFVGSNPVALIASGFVGKAKVIGILEGLIDKGGPSKCTYPAHAVPVCKKGDPCYFDCKDGYTPSPASKPTQCVCKSPNKECNGKCGKYAACPSGKPKRELLPRDSACARGLTACGVLGGRRNAFECVDTVSDLESCGGCVVPLAYTAKSSGVDCSAISGVSDVSCVNSRCVVHRCRPGHRLAHDRSTCEYDEDRDPVLLAAQYGLEHIPLY
ncbi:hypothetical protein BDV98DRAFT_608239 [Pterulicium gracile]|uniref:Protein CPL1-like domain-containing protein n=1 Tax=Pterulicium gracile TaxID=1884261 RepID=A0A5C3Q3X6_9AGAR|nr:hypothetical protein BDV98DRAFT_608239 [Pterula gracilis]